MGLKQDEIPSPQTTVIAVFIKTEPCGKIRSCEHTLKIYGTVFCTRLTGECCVQTLSRPSLWIPSSVHTQSLSNCWDRSILRWPQRLTVWPSSTESKGGYHCPGVRVCSRTDRDSRLDRWAQNWRRIVARTCRDAMGGLHAVGKSSVEDGRHPCWGLARETRPHRCYCRCVALDKNEESGFVPSKRSILRLFS